MTDNQRKAIRTMRMEGLGYKSIAEHIGVSLSAVRGYCRRNGLGGFAWAGIIPQERPPNRCKVCGRYFRQKPLGRKRIYCSNACRQRNYRRQHFDSASWITAP